MNRILNPLVNRIRMMIGRGIIRLVDDSTNIQNVQLSLLKNETRSKVERFQNYGFTSVPLTGTEAIVLFPGGNRDHGIVLGIGDRRFRIKSLEPGEVAIYTDEGDKLEFKRDNNIIMTTENFTVNAGTKVEINTPLVDINATSAMNVTTPTMTVNASSKATFDTPLVEVSGNIIDQFATNADNMAGMRAKYNTHTHDENNVLDGPTDGPSNQMGS